MNLRGRTPRIQARGASAPQPGQTFPQFPRDHWISSDFVSSAEGPERARPFDLPPSGPASSVGRGIKKEELTVLLAAVELFVDGSDEGRGTRGTIAAGAPTPSCRADRQQGWKGSTACAPRSTTPSQHFAAAGDLLGLAGRQGHGVGE